MVASDAMEFRGIAPLVEDLRKTRLALEWSREGTWKGHDILLAANGVGAARAGAAVDTAATFRPDAVISTGFCGALDPGLRIAEAVVATCIATAGRRYRALPVAAGARHASGVVSSIGHVARTALEKRSLRDQGGSVVEMEAAGVAERAESLGVPFYCVRAVTDLAGEDMANDFNRALRPDGHFDTITIFRHALRHPVARLPELLRLRQNCEQAARTLGEFFADCRF